MINPEAIKRWNIVADELDPDLREKFEELHYEFDPEGSYAKMAMLNAEPFVNEQYPVWYFISEAPLVAITTQLVRLKRKDHVKNDAHKAS